ncbi:MAG: response regulator [Ignavibacteria bacterium]|nr:response regulator [Ignavibacteria bacterium]MBT8383083.1 response regulator [Ignavibacteria bacterium]MBT8392378.1 response regulator [Ignavibacteria bacterium]NNJ52955.1 response regulator [Ignavibacteriaceae bacterium]NNL22198.1 response regulator [Ignavibacteriaceae bacterium]
MIGERKNILVVEDNRETQLIIKVALRDNYNVELINNAADAINVVRNNSFDIILLDVNLNGEGDGKDILTFLREKYNKTELPVIIMTAYDLSDEDKTFFNENANTFISKPIDKKIICSEIEKLIFN